MESIQLTSFRTIFVLFLFFFNYHFFEGGGGGVVVKISLWGISQCWPGKRSWSEPLTSPLLLQAIQWKQPGLPNNCSSSHTRTHAQAWQIRLPNSTIGHAGEHADETLCGTNTPTGVVWKVFGKVFYYHCVSIISVVFQQFCTLLPRGWNVSCLHCCRVLFTTTPDSPVGPQEKEKRRNMSVHPPPAQTRMWLEQTETASVMVLTQLFSTSLIII